MHRLLLKILPLILLFFCKIEARPLKINIFTYVNGRGLEVDQRVLSQELKNLGHDARCINLLDTYEQTEADINIFIQVIDPVAFPYATFNWFVPNPEWYLHPLELLDGIDLILCRTKEVERIFQALQRETYFIGFTSPDRLQPHIEKDFTKFLHVAGVSLQKGTGAIEHAWKQHPDFPSLLIIQNNGRPFLTHARNVETFNYQVEENLLRYYQNQAGFHLCLSETEGYGHYLMEAMSVGAVVVATDAPPMNEFITDSRCLVPYKRSEPYYLAINYYVDENALESVIHALMLLPMEELQKIGLNNRKCYLKKTEQFRQRLARLLTLVQCPLWLKLKHKPQLKSVFSESSSPYKD